MKIEEDKILSTIKNVILEEVSKVNRYELNKVQFKMDELENQLMETVKELRKLDDSIPDGLKTVTNGRLKTISTNLSGAHTALKQLKNKVKEYKKSLYQQQNDKK
jgi:ClpP class serine protease